VTERPEDAHVEVASVHDFGFFRVERSHVRHQLYDGGLSDSHARQLVRKRDFAAVLLTDSERQCLWLVEQFRACAWLKAPEHGWLAELVAGTIEDGETPDAAARRETLEETGVAPAQLQPLGWFFLSPGYTDERCYLFCAEIGGQSPAARAGAADEDEDIRPVALTYSEIDAALADGRIVDAKTLYALALWRLNNPR